MKLILIIIGGCLLTLINKKDLVISNIICTFALLNKKTLIYGSKENTFTSSFKSITNHGF